MGPIVAGTTISTTVLININTNTIFQIVGYIDTEAVINTFTATTYMYRGQLEGSGAARDSILSNFYDSSFGTSWQV